MSYFDGSKAPLWGVAKTYTLMDHFHHAAFGGSFLNHIYMICACAPKFPNAPDEIVAKLDDKGILVKDGAVTPDGFAVNTLYPVGGPFHQEGYPKARLVPLQSDATIGDRLDAKGVNWAYYAGGWDDAVGKRDPLFQFHHQPFAYFANYALACPARRRI